MCDKDLSKLAEKLGAALQKRQLRLVLAESCTGGMVAEAVTRMPGSSAWFDRGFVTYSNQAKIDMLGVSQETLEKYGAVSEEVATEMAQGCLKSSTLKRSQAYIAGSITGIAGPDGGSTEKPVGTVYFAWTNSTQATFTTTQYFSGNRQQIRQQATVFLMQQLVETLS